MRYVANRRVALLGAALLSTLGLAVSASAQVTFQPGCGAEGDPVIVEAQGMTTTSAIEFSGGIAATVLRQHGTRALVQVPTGATTGPITVDGTASADDFTVLAPGTPAIFRASAARARPGDTVVLVGLRLRVAGQTTTASLVEQGNATNVTAASVRAGRRVAAVVIPSSMAAGFYHVVIDNGLAASPLGCSPVVEVVTSPLSPTIVSIDPAGATPGQRIEATTQDIRSGFCTFVWEEQGAGAAPLRAPGIVFRDRAVSFVPRLATPGATYDVHIEAGGQSTPAVAYAVGTPGAPVVQRVDPARGLPGSIFAVVGTGFFSGPRPVVELVEAASGTATQALLLGGLPGRGVLFCAVPRSIATFGAHEVRVTVGARSSSGGPTYEVVAPTPPAALSVTAVTYDSSPHPVTSRPRGAVVEGAGFGARGDRPAVIVVLEEQGGGARRLAFVTRREDARLEVQLPFLRPGTYDLRVIRGAQTAVAPVAYVVVPLTTPAPIEPAVGPRP